MAQDHDPNVKKSVVAKVNGEVWDLSREISSDSSLEYLVLSFIPLVDLVRPHVSTPPPPPPPPPLAAVSLDCGGSIGSGCLLALVGSCVGSRSVCSFVPNSREKKGTADLFSGFLVSGVVALEKMYGDQLLLCDGPPIKQGGFFYEFALPTATVSEAS